MEDKMRLLESQIENVVHKYPGSRAFRIPQQDPKEVVLEIFRATDGSWSSAVAIIGASESHFHARTVEDYLVLEGTLQITIGGDNRTSNDLVNLGPGDSLRITPGEFHRAIAIGELAPVVLVIARPAWSHNDHILIPDWK